MDEMNASNGKDYAYIVYRLGIKYFNELITANEVVVFI
jgi:hypothetical protein